LAVTRPFVVVPAELPHAYALARNLRDDDIAELAMIGLTPRAGVRKCFRNSIAAFAGFVDGELIGMYGIGGTLMGETGYPWMLSSCAMDRLPLRIRLSVVRHAQEELVGMLNRYRRVEINIPATLPHALKLARVLGFKVGEAYQVPPRGELLRLCVREAA